MYWNSSLTKISNANQKPLRWIYKLKVKISKYEVFSQIEVPLSVCTFTVYMFIFEPFNFRLSTLEKGFDSSWICQA